MIKCVSESIIMRNNVFNSDSNFNWVRSIADEVHNFFNNKPSLLRSLSASIQVEFNIKSSKPESFKEFL